MLIDKLIISKYTSYFHDGSLMDIQYGRDSSELILSMESAEVDPEDIEDPISLSKEERIKGKLHLKGIKTIKVDDKTFTTPLKIIYDDAEIAHLKIKNNQVTLKIIWKNFPPNPDINDFSTVDIDVEDVYWENIPDLDA